MKPRFQGRVAYFIMENGNHNSHGKLLNRSPPHESKNVKQHNGRDLKRGEKGKVNGKESATHV